MVADNYQGKGLGIKLVDMFIDVAKEKCIESMYGMIMAENLRMIRLCEKLGFTIRKE